MIISPMVRGNICINSHPAGCAALVSSWAERVRLSLRPGPAPQGLPRLVLVVGCSTGYGLASRAAAAFGCGAATVGVSLEKAGTPTKAGTPGWYNNLAFDALAARGGLASLTLDGDAFSAATKALAARALREAASRAGVAPEVDLVVYSLASPARADPADGRLHRSVIKPIGSPYSGLALDAMSGRLTPATVAPATEAEIAATVKVMGGEDWALWLEALSAEGLLAPRARSVAFSYVGPELSWPIYRDGTIGRAKADLEATARRLDGELRRRGGGAWVSVNKAAVTRSSAVIPVISLYIASLFKVMKARGLHEGCVEQAVRLFRERLYAPGAARDPAGVAVDAEGRIRLDDREMLGPVQIETEALMSHVDESNLAELTDLAGLRHDFLEAHGFDVDGVDYGAEVDSAGVPA